MWGQVERPRVGPIGHGDWKAVMVQRCTARVTPRMRWPIWQPACAAASRASGYPLSLSPVGGIRFNAAFTETTSLRLHRPLRCRFALSPPRPPPRRVSASVSWSSAAAAAAALAMARPLPNQTVARTSATSLRYFPGHSKPSLPLSAPALRKAAAALLLAAAVALPCAVLYRAAVLDAVQPVQVGWDRGPWWERGQPPPAVVVPEEDGDVDPAAADDLVRFASTSSSPSFLLFNFVPLSFSVAVLVI